MNITPEVKSALLVARSRLEELLDREGIPGCSVAVVQDQNVIWSEGFGFASKARSLKATPFTIYRVASITKLFTATMLIQLRDAGKLLLDEPVEKYLPELKIRSSFSNNRPPNFRDIVSHMGGLPREAPLDYWKSSTFPPIEEIIKSLSKAQLTFPRQSEFKYSNLGFALLGHVLSRIAGVSYRDYIVEKILQPLKMSQSDFELTGEMRDQFASAYIDPADLSKVAPERPGISGFIAAGQLYSSVNDMASFISLQFLNESNSVENAVLASSSLREMQAPVYINPDWSGGQGLGWAIERMGRNLVIGHLGSLPGFNTSIKIIPGLKLGVALFTNTLTNAGSLNRAVLEILVPPFEIERTQREAQVGKPLPQNWPELVGWYTFSGVDRMVVQNQDGRLVGHFPKSPELETIFVPKGEDRFYMIGGSVNGEIAVFERGSKGEITMVQLGDYFYNRDD